MRAIGTPIEEAPGLRRWRVTYSDAAAVRRHAVNSRRPLEVHLSILVFGATGSVGQQVATGLQRRAGGVRALVRSGLSNTKAGWLEAAGVGLVDGDLARPGIRDAACAGVDTIVCTATSMPSAPDRLRRVDLTACWRSSMLPSARASAGSMVITFKRGRNRTGRLAGCAPTEVARMVVSD